MSAGMRAFWVIFVALLAVNGAGVNAQTGKPKPDILCENAPEGAVEKVPARVSEWIVLLCTPEGQALGPKLDKDVVLWLIHNRKIPFMLYAYPQGLRKDPTFIKKFGQYPYQLRWSGFASSKANGRSIEKFMRLFAHAFPDLRDKRIDGIVELHALSSSPGILYKMYLFLVDEMLAHIAICLNGCQYLVALDVLTGDALKKRIEQP